MCTKCVRQGCWQPDSLCGPSSVSVVHVFMGCRTLGWKVLEQTGRRVCAALCIATRTQAATVATSRRTTLILGGDKSRVVLFGIVSPQDRPSVRSPSACNTDCSLCGGRDLRTIEASKGSIVHRVPVSLRDLHRPHKGTVTGFEQWAW